MNEIIVGSLDGEPIIYETSESDSVILGMLTKLLVSTFVTFGVRALCKLVASKEFKIKYPGGNLRMIYKLIQHATDDPNHEGCDISLGLDNLVLS